MPASVGKRFLLGGDTRIIISTREEEEDGLDDDRDEKGKGDEEQQELWERELMIKEVECILDIFGDSYCNKHLVYGVLELVIVRLFPEMGEKGVKELMEARLGEE